MVKKKVQLEQQLEQQLVYRSFNRRRHILIVFTMLISILSLVWALLLFLNGDDQWGNKRFSKQEIQSKLITTIKNGGSLETVKHIYAARQHEPYSIIDMFRSTSDTYYYEPTSLSFILRDIQANSYQTSLYKDSIFVNNLEIVIQDHERKYPFDGLEDSQKTIFENILVKLNNNYDVVQQDVSKLANEIKNQNQLVYTYLNKSTKSYFISIAALIITIVASIYQIIQTNKTNNMIKSLSNKATNSENNQDGNKDV